MCQISCTADAYIAARWSPLNASLIALVRASGVDLLDLGAAGVNLRTDTNRVVRVATPEQPDNEANQNASVILVRIGSEHAAAVTCAGELSVYLACLLLLIS